MLIFNCDELLYLKASLLFLLQYHLDNAVYIGPWYPWWIRSRTPCGYQNPWTMKSGGGQSGAILELGAAPDPPEIVYWPPQKTSRSWPEVTSSSCQWLPVVFGRSSEVLQPWFLCPWILNSAGAEPADKENLLYYINKKKTEHVRMS